MTNYLNRHEQFLQKLITNSAIPAEEIHQAIQYSLFPGGKRIRPQLVYLMGVLVEVDLPVLDVIASAVEITHCYSLIHDDLPAMDNDDMRRGKPSCHKAFNEATAILVGDGLQAFAIEILLSHLDALLPAKQVLAVTLELVKASGIHGMVSGQSLDLTLLSQATINEVQLRQIHLLKTGKLIAACAEMVLAAQPHLNEPSQQALRTYASHVGLVFQMQDDYLDQYAATTVLGKAHSSDSANNKTTFANLYTQAQLQEKIDGLYHEALHALAVFGPQASDLRELTQSLQERTSGS